MTMAALTFAPEAFDVGVDIFGVTNWIRTLKSIPPWWASFKDALYQELGDPFSADSTRLKQISPLFHTQNVTKPLIVLQGAQDPRPPQGRSVSSDRLYWFRPLHGPRGRARKTVQPLCRCLQLVDAHVVYISVGASSRFVYAQNVSRASIQNGLPTSH